MELIWLWDPTELLNKLKVLVAWVGVRRGHLTHYLHCWHRQGGGLGWKVGYTMGLVSLCLSIPPASPCLGGFGLWLSASDLFRIQLCSHAGAFVLFWRTPVCLGPLYREVSLVDTLLAKGCPSLYFCHPHLTCRMTQKTLNLDLLRCGNWLKVFVATASMAENRMPI